MPTPEEVRQQMEDVLSLAAEGVEGARIRVRVNADGSVDGELLAPVERGESVESVLETVEETLRENRIAKTFTTTGFRWEPRSDEEHLRYDRYKGLFQVFSHYYRNPQESVATTEEILGGMRAKRFRKPIQAIVRLHWNRHGTKPPREAK